MEITIDLVIVLKIFLWYLAVGSVLNYITAYFVIKTQLINPSENERRKKLVYAVWRSFILSWASPYIVFTEWRDIREGAISRKLYNSSFINKENGTVIDYKDLCVEYAKTVDVEFWHDESPTFWAINKQTKIYKFAKQNYDFKSKKSANAR